MMDALFYTNNIFTHCLCTAVVVVFICSFINQHWWSCSVLIETLKGESWVVSLSALSRAFWYYLSQTAANKLLFTNWSLILRDTALQELSNCSSSSRGVCWSWFCVSRYPCVLVLCSVSRDRGSQCTDGDWDLLWKEGEQGGITKYRHTMRNVGLCMFTHCTWVYHILVEKYNSYMTVTQFLCLIGVGLSQYWKKCVWNVAFLTLYSAIGHLSSLCF